jgi:hypothetical protein
VIAKIEYFNDARMAYLRCSLGLVEEALHDVRILRVVRQERLDGGVLAHACRLRKMVSKVSGL